MHSFTLSVARRLLVVSLFALPSQRLSAQAATDTTTARPKALGAVVVSATRTEQSLSSLPTHVVVLDATGHRVVGGADGARPAAQPFRGSRRATSSRDSSAARASRSSRFAGSAARRPAARSCCSTASPRATLLGVARLGAHPAVHAAVRRESCAAAGRRVWGSRSLGGIVNLRTIDPRARAARSS